MKPVTRVIIIDDDPLNNFIIRQNVKLISASVEVIEFTNPDKAFEFMAKNSSASFDTLVLLDLNMPQVSGWDLLDKFSALDPGIKAGYIIYILSSSTDTNDQDMANKHPEIKKYLIKPISPADLKKVLL
ncbi:MAG: response regulator [Bacteroidia bacterium]